MSRLPQRLLVLSLLAAAPLGCPLRKLGDKGDAAAAAASAAASSTGAPPEAGAPALHAANEADVTRYPEQAPGNGETLTTTRFSPVRTEVGAGGSEVAVLRPDTEVQKLAAHEGSDLVLFADPKNGTQRLEGWVNHVMLREAPARHEPAPPDRRSTAVADAGPPAPSPAPVASAQPAPPPPAGGAVEAFLGSWKYSGKSNVVVPGAGNSTMDIQGVVTLVAGSSGQIVAVSGFGLKGCTLRFAVSGSKASLSPPGQGCPGGAGSQQTWSAATIQLLGPGAATYVDASTMSNPHAGLWTNSTWTKI